MNARCAAMMTARKQDMGLASNWLRRRQDEGLKYDLLFGLGIWGLYVTGLIGSGVFQSIPLFLVSHASVLLLPVWIFTRVTPRILELTEPHLREELGVTLLRAEEYLSNLLNPQIRYAFDSIKCVAPILGFEAFLAFVALLNGEARGIFLVVFFFLFLLSNLALTRALIHYFIECRLRMKYQDPNQARTFCAMLSIIAVFSPLAPVLALYPILGWFSFLAAPILTIGFALDMSKRTWRRILKSYWTVE
ncbi:MAG: hypothetical protein NTX50_11575 [Candidatus Sumerlaeota bacterium]|nr:hypothetical protein [Candidatus Sumerlaeota bacterium]